MSAGEIIIVELESGVAGLVSNIVDFGIEVAAGTVETAQMLAQRFGEGVADVINAMSKENRERLELEREWMNRITAEREKSFNTINAYIASMIKLAESDASLEKLKGNFEAAEMFRSLVDKREKRITRLRELREKAVRSRDMDIINECAHEAELTAEGLFGEIQAETVFFAKLGVNLPAYGTLHDDAIKMALAKRNDTGNFLLRINSDSENVIMADVCADYGMFEESMSLLLCEEGLNNGQLRDIYAIKRDLKLIMQDEKTTPLIKRKRMTTLFDTFSKRKQAIMDELRDMKEYYEKYLQYTYDIPDKRMELFEFDSIDWIYDAVNEAREDMKKRLQKQYVQKQVDRVMAKHGMNVVTSAVMGRNEDDERILYGINDKAAIDVFVSEQGMLSTRVVGVSFDGNHTAKDEEELIQIEHKTCSKLAEVEKDLEDVGIRLGLKKRLRPGEVENNWIALDEARPSKKSNEIRRKKRQADRKVMYME